MAGKKLIWLACGSGVASSVMAAETLKRLCRERGLVADIQVVAFRDIRGLSRRPDLLVSIAPGIERGDYLGFKDIPIIQGVSLLTGIGVDKTIKEIEKALKGGASD